MTSADELRVLRKLERVSRSTCAFFGHKAGTRQDCMRCVLHAELTVIRARKALVSAERT